MKRSRDANRLLPSHSLRRGWLRVWPHAPWVAPHKARHTRADSMPTASQALSRFHGHSFAGPFTISVMATASQALSRFQSWPPLRRPYRASHGRAHSEVGGQTAGLRRARAGKGPSREGPEPGRARAGKGPSRHCAARRADHAALKQLSGAGRSDQARGPSPISAGWLRRELRVPIWVERGRACAAVGRPRLCAESRFAVRPGEASAASCVGWTVRDRKWRGDPRDARHGIH